jgi:hypothetical protein
MSTAFCGKISLRRRYVMALGFCLLAYSITFVKVMGGVEYNIRSKVIFPQYFLRVLVN